MPARWRSSVSRDSLTTRLLQHWINREPGGCKHITLFVLVAPLADICVAAAWQALVMLCWCAVDAGSNTKDTLGQKAAKLDRETEELKRALIALLMLRVRFTHDAETSLGIRSIASHPVVIGFWSVMMLFMLQLRQAAQRSLRAMQQWLSL